jgi:ketosteroid isomerase-like protein
MWKGLRAIAFVAAAFWGLGAATASGAPASGAPASGAELQSQRDGGHDFDWEFGTWNTHVRVLRNPLSGQPPDWAEYQGTSVVRPVLGGRFNLVELSVAGARGRIEGASLRLYEPQSHRWSLNYSNAGNGELTAPVYGAFDGRGRGTFLANDSLDGRPILVRFIITVVSNNEAHFEQAYSADGGKTWEVNWIAVDSKAATAQGSSSDFGAAERGRHVLPTDLARALNAYDQATIHKDVAVLSALVTDDYVLVNSDASVQNKESYLADFAMPDFTLQTDGIVQPLYRVLGKTALTGGVFHLNWTQHGSHLSRTLRIAHVWIKDRGRWRIAYTQLTRVPE